MANLVRWPSDDSEMTHSHYRTMALVGTRHEDADFSVDFPRVGIWRVRFYAPARAERLNMSIKSDAEPLFSLLGPGDISESSPTPDGLSGPHGLRTSWKVPRDASRRLWMLFISPSHVLGKLEEDVRRLRLTDGSRSREGAVLEVFEDGILDATVH